jgi:hypothetical protein
LTRNLGRKAATSTNKYADADLYGTTTSVLQKYDEPGDELGAKKGGLIVKGSGAKFATIILSFNLD